MSRWRARLDRFLGLAGVTLFALAPKCVLCLAAYAGLGALVGLRFAPDVCGAHPASPTPALLGLALLGASLALWTWRRVRHRRARDRRSAA